MTVVDERPGIEVLPTPAASGVVARDPGLAPAPPAPLSSPERVRWLFVAWVVALPIALALVIYGFGPYFQDRAQRGRLADYRDEMGLAVHASSGLPGATGPVRAPEPGSTVGILEIGRLHLQEAVVEGVSSANTRIGPGHVPGTAGLGQPGNSVVVGRRSGFGGSFHDLGSLRKHDELVVTTTQGRSVYKVTSVQHVQLTQPSADDASDSASVGGSTSADDDAVTIDDTYGPSDDDRLTLITSASRLPGNTTKAVVVVAQLQDAPFPATPQGGRTDRGTGTQSDQDARAAALLCVLLYGIGIGGSVLLYRRLPARVGYLLTVAPIVALTIITGETISRLFPAWM